MNSEIEQLLSRLQILLPEGSKACIETHNQEKTRYDSAATSKKSDSQIADQQCHKRDSHEWTTSDDWLLRLAWGTVNIDSIASMLDRQVSEVQSRIEDYRSRLVTEPWQPEELRLLAKLYGSRANIDLESRGQYSYTAYGFMLQS